MVALARLLSLSSHTITLSHTMTRTCVMPLAAWVLLATFTWCSYAHAAPIPPVAAALSSTSQDLPGSQAWVGGAGDLYPISQEGSKRGYSDRNYLRFGRSDLGDYNSGDENLNDSLEKRSRNFLRFGRPDMEDIFVAGGPMEIFAGLQDEVDEEDLPFEKQQVIHNIPRFARGDRNFLRLGRSVDRQLNSLVCVEPKTPGINSIPSPTPVQPMTRAKQGISHSIESSEPRERSSQRTKRAAAPTFYDYGSIQSYSPTSWARRFQPEEEIITVSSEDPQDVNKRANDGNFLHFGRDRNFLRFGKRDRANEYPPSSSEASGSLVVARPAERVPKRNFLRFG